MVESRATVMHGGGRTSGGLTKKDLKYNTKGEIVSKEKSKQAKANPWIKAVQKAKKDLGIKGFALVEGELKKKAHMYYDKMKK